MRILMAASECVPFVKTGGLGDVLGALPKALVKLGHQVAVILPRHGAVRLDHPRVAIPSLSVRLGPNLRFVTILEGPTLGGVRTFFVEYPEFYDRWEVYGDYWDNAGRFAFFCRAVLEAAKHVFPPDVLHGHDWQTALIPVLKKTEYSFDWAYSRTAVLLTLHNLGYQGVFDKSAMDGIGLSWDLFRMDRLEQHDRVNFLKGGILYADSLTTVSRKYAEEIQTPEYGFGLDGVIRARAGALRGILNGVDYAEWNPAGDRHIAAHYTPEDLSGKRECKRDLERIFDLPEQPDRPIIGIVSRFVAQKGFDLIAQVAYDIAAEDLQMVALGTGERQYEELFLALERHFPDKVRVRIAYDNALAHKIEAGADMFLMPSRYEPCGLNQIYSLKYGTVPIVRATGGLDDTIDAETGFKFVHYDGTGLLWAVREALAAWRDRQRWEAMMRAGMARDFSWDRSAREYAALYEEAGR
jgi:starch synthase